MKKLLDTLPEIRMRKVSVGASGYEHETYADGYIDEVKEAIKKLRDMTNGCPICIFSALRQKGIDVYEVGFDLKKELAEYWSEENAREYEADQRASLYG